MKSSTLFCLVGFQEVRKLVIDLGFHKNRKCGRTILYVLFPALCLQMLSCGYHFWAGELRPLDEEIQKPGTRVSDDGTVSFIEKRLEVSLRPMPDEQLNRQFSAHSKAGRESTNPYTFGDWRDPETGGVPGRFTVFLLKVKNYTYPKMQVDPSKALIVTDIGMEHSSLGLWDLERYYQPYITGYAGISHERFEKRKDILKATLYSGEVVFSGQETEGYVVFPKLHHTVKKIHVILRDVALRFDVRDEPIETVDLEYGFYRETGRLYADGRLVKDTQK